MKPQYLGTWRITEMEVGDADYVNLTGPGQWVCLQNRPGDRVRGWF